MESFCFLNPGGLCLILLVYDASVVVMREMNKLMRLQLILLEGC